MFVISRASPRRRRRAGGRGRGVSVSPARADDSRRGPRAARERPQRDRQGRHRDPREDRRAERVDRRRPRRQDRLRARLRHWRARAPKLRRRPQMRYSIGSISKQFTAAAILLLAEEGKLSLDDKVGPLAARSDARGRRHHPPAAVDDLRLPGLLAAGLRDADDAEAGRRRRRSSTAGRRSRSTSSRARSGSTATPTTSSPA